MTGCLSGVHLSTCHLHSRFLLPSPSSLPRCCCEPRSVLNHGMNSAAVFASGDCDGFSTVRALGFAERGFDSRATIRLAHPEVRPPHPFPNIVSTRHRSFTAPRSLASAARVRDTRRDRCWNFLSPSEGSWARASSNLGTTGRSGGYCFEGRYWVGEGFSGGQVSSSCSFLYIRALMS